MKNLEGNSMLKEVKFLLFFFLALNLYGQNLVLDIGHSKKFGGSTSATCEKEYFYNKALVLYVLENLKPNISATLSAKIDEESTFKERNEASKNKDLFLSFHHDSVQEQFINKGTICPRTSCASGFSVFVSRKNLDLQASLKAATIFAQSLVDQGLKPTLHHAEKIKGENRELIDKNLGLYYFDDLLVLKNAKSPAFLFEAGVIVNPEDEELVKSEEYKAKIAQAVNELFN